MALLALEGIRKSFFGVEVLHGVSFTAESGRVLGLIGENGSGKSTAMNIVGGVHQPDGGSMQFDGKPYAPGGPRDARASGIAFIHQELNLFENLSIEENIFIGGFPRLHAYLPFMSRRQISRRTRELLDMVELAYAPGTPLGHLSQGERQLVEITKALNTDARLIIFDEPTTSLTSREVERLFAIIGRLKARGIAVVYISHILGEVLRLCDEIMVLRDGALVGNGLRDQMSIERMISLMVGRSIDQLFPPRPDRVERGPLLTVRGLTQPGMIKNVSFRVEAGEIVGLAGLMGSGRSETARILFGLDPHKSGSIELLGQTLDRATPGRCMDLGMAFLTEDRRAEGLLMSAPILSSIELTNLDRHAESHIGWIRQDTLLREADRMARKVQLSTLDIVNTLSRNLSGGNQQKVVLAKWLMRAPKLFILDEPTRGVDVGAKYEIYKIINQLVETGAGVLLISSEMEELIGMCDRILVMSNGEISGEFSRHGFNQERILEAAMRHGLRQVT
jgi:ribose transport system ATP-binding protein